MIVFSILYALLEFWISKNSKTYLIVFSRVYSPILNANILQQKPIFWWFFSHYGKWTQALMEFWTETETEFLVVIYAYKKYDGLYWDLEHRLCKVLVRSPQVFRSYCWLIYYIH